MTYLLSIDPGKATGITLGHYSEHEPWQRIDYWLVKGGVQGFIHWHHAIAPPQVFAADWVSEAFVLSGGNDFVANLESVKIEGAMEALGLHPTYQFRYDKALCKDEVLQRNGLWVTGKMCSHTDGRDVNDSAIHALARMKKLKHEPSLRTYWG